ncbi:expressed unknown protein [Ectocarpus siliculosus]|uniref:Uncharacterized protein n=1 Tax=Ectocarpus siliculosus TaxID=2880 RepID=D8LRW4_ECTSI|nr:expressed unknown protein [Ectocarpus siliculosus]|eukprot:CBN73881.1 expressed unknown protein [Ectocarpus siliculosus]
MRYKLPVVGVLEAGQKVASKVDANSARTRTPKVARTCGKRTALRVAIWSGLVLSIFFLCRCVFSTWQLWRMASLCFLLCSFSRQNAFPAVATAVASRVGW